MILIVSLQSQITIQTESGENRGINVPAYLQGLNQIRSNIYNLSCYTLATI
jgi:hypothetical protein